jgi:hypothetical protein
MPSHGITEYLPPAEDPLRREFLDELNRVGWWPREPHKLALANGSGRGDDNGVPPGAEALKCTGQLHIFNTTTLYTQASGDNELVAKLKCTVIDNPPSTEQPIEVYTNEMLEFDGAPGGTLESFGIARDVIATYAPLAVTKSDYRSICFVPSISAVAIRIPATARTYTSTSASFQRKTANWTNSYVLPTIKLTH